MWPVINQSTWVGIICWSLEHGGVFVLNSDIPTNQLFRRLTERDQRILMERRIRFYNINALEIAQNVGLGTRINTVMQTLFLV